MEAERNGNMSDPTENARDGEQQFHGEGLSDEARGFLFEQAMAQTRMAVCVTDPRRDDNPIVFANRAFLDLTGYPADEVIGQNCRFLQGPDTDPEMVRRLRDAIRTEQVIVVEILNYRRDGTPFWNALHLGPLYDVDGSLKYYFGSQWDVSDMYEERAERIRADMMVSEITHRMKNLFSVIGAIVTIQGRADGRKASSARLRERIDALGRAHSASADIAAEGAEVDLKSKLRIMLDPYIADREQALDLSGPAVDIGPNTLSTLGLVLHELAINASKYGALSTEDGTISVGWTVDERADGPSLLDLTWTERGGPRLDGEPQTRGLGADLVEKLLGGSGGAIVFHWHPEGLRAELKMPLGG
jgi:PAS domain S-box-containing protein